MKLLGIRSTARAGRERRRSRSVRSCSSTGLRSAPTPSGGCCTQWTSRSRRIGRTLSQASSASVVIVPDATGSLWSSRPSVENSRQRICPSSVSMARSASSSVTSKTAVAPGGAKPHRSRITTFPPTPKGWHSRMESTMSVAIPVCSSWAPPEKPRSLRSMPSNTGGAVCGRKHYPGATELLILADSGGANSARCKVWKCDLQQKLCNAYGLRITVCHYPPGASK